MFGQSDKKAAGSMEELWRLRREAVKKETHGRTELAALQEGLNELELQQKTFMQTRIEGLNPDIAEPIIAEIEKLGYLKKDKGWATVGDITRSREEYIRKFCKKDGPLRDLDLAKRYEIEKTLTVLLTYLPRVIYRCFGCRHDFYDSYIGKLSRIADENAFNEHYSKRFNVSPLNIVHKIEGWKEFKEILDSQTTNTPKMEKAWAAFQRRIYDWINQQPWGTQFQCLPLEVKLSRVSGDADENIKVLKKAVERLRTDITKELCLVPDTNGSEGAVCHFCVDMRNSLATIDGAGVVPRNVADQVIVGPIHSSQSGTSGYLTLKEETLPLIFHFLSSSEAAESLGINPDNLPDNHNILIFWGKTLLASCPNKLSVNQLISNMIEVGYLGASGGTRGGRNIKSCEFRFYEQLTTEEKVIILQAAKALGDKFPCDIAMAISKAGDLRNAYSRGVLVPSPNATEIYGDIKLICMGLTIDGLCFLNFTSSGQACLKAHGKTMTLSIPTNVISADIKPILIKSFGLKLVECRAFFETQSQNALRSVLEAVYLLEEETSLATIVQKLAAARRVKVYLERIRHSLFFINQILTAISEERLPDALTLMKTNNDKISFGCGEVIDDIFGTIADDEHTFPRLVVVNTESCNPKYEMKLVEEPETTSDKTQKRLKRFADTNKGVMYDFTRYMLKANPKLDNNPSKLDTRIKEMFRIVGKNPSKEDAEGFLPGLSKFLHRYKISFGDMMSYLSSSLTEKGAKGKSIPPSGAPAAAKAEISFGNALLGARVLKGKRRGGEWGTLQPIPMEIISKIIDTGSLDTILRYYNNERLKNAIGETIDKPRVVVTDTSIFELFKYLSYLSTSIIMWFENNYPDIFSLGGWESVISSLILESLPSDARSGALNNMIQALSRRLYPPDIIQRPIQIARKAVTRRLYDKSVGRAPPSVTVERVATGGNQMYIDIDGLWDNIRILEVERQDLLRNGNVTRLLPVFAEGGGGMMGGPPGMMGVSRRRKTRKKKKRKRKKTRRKRGKKHKRKTRRKR